MLKPRYFYSEPYSLASVKYVTDGEGFLVDPIEDAVFERHCPRLTICGIWNTETNVMTFGIATCSKNDVFTKRIGRELSYERAMNNPVKSIDLDESNISEQFLTVAREFEHEHRKKIFRCL